MSRLKGRIALVTGAQQGIGAAICIAMARDGADVAVNWLDNQADAEKVAAEVREHGVRAVTIKADIGTTAGRAFLQSETERLLGLPDILVCNAGIFPRAHFLDLTEEMWDAVHDVNLKATAFQAQLFCRALVKAGKPGAAIAMSSSAVRGDPNGAHYSATKTGLLGVTRSIALAVADKGIRINAIAPGLTDTAQPRYGNTEEQIAERVKLIPISRLGQPQDIAEMACFLCSEQASWITGQVYHVNGGLYMP